MTKRPLLCGVAAFVIGELTGQNKYMTWGLGMVALLFLLWQIIDKRNRKDTMPFLMILIPICILLGMFNGWRSRLLPPLQVYMEEELQTNHIECTLQGRIQRIEIQGGRRILIIKAEQLERETFRSTEPYCIKLYESQNAVSNTELCIGNRIQCSLTLEIPDIPTNPGEFNSRAYYRARGIDFLGFADEITVFDNHQIRILQNLWELRTRARTVFYEGLSQDNASVMCAMLLGDSGDLDSELKKLYQRNGIAHILAISGLHVSILGTGLYQLLRKIGCNYLTAGIPVIILLLMYGWLTGLSGSTIRAIIMLVLMIVGEMIGRTYDMLTAVGISGLLILLEYPDRLYDAGFLLSFSAVLALGIVVPEFKEQIPVNPEKTVRNKLIESAVSGLAIQLMTGPISIYFYYDFPVYGIFLNFIVIPLMTPVVVCGFISLLVFPFSSVLSSLVILPCEWILNGFTILCKWVEQIPGAIYHAGAVPLWIVWLYYLVLFAGLMLIKKKKTGYAVCLMLFFGSLVWVQDSSELTITMLDVGQGDSIFVETPGHHYLLVDGGSSSRSSVGQYVITPAVKYYGSGHLDYVFVSHMDEDHVNGIKQLIELSQCGGIQVRYLVVPELARNDRDFMELVDDAKQANITVLMMRAGDVMQVDQVVISCLYPEDGSGFSDANNNSMVLSLNYHSFDMLFTGDLEAEGEELVPKQSYDVLKVGHHGSSGASSMEFLEKVQPHIALISCGKNNNPTQIVIQA